MLKLIMSDELLGPIVGSPLRVENREQLEDFLLRPDARAVVRGASFEEVFFAIKNVGLADSLDLLPMITGRQARGFIDLDCWRKDTFFREPFMEWIAAFVQSGPEETVRALSSIDESVISLFMKDLIQVYEVDREDPPEGPNIIFTPDSRFAVEPVDQDEDRGGTEGQAATIAMLILDALFKYNPHLGAVILRTVRYTTRIDLEETAFQDKTRRLEVHGFVDYYEAISIYAAPETGYIPADPGRERPIDDVSGDDPVGNLPAVFADSLSGAAFLQTALSHITDPAESERLTAELTALGNRMLSANLVNLGDLDNVRPVLEEMRDVLSIGLEYLTGGRPELTPDVFRASYVQTIFKAGFSRIARLRDRADGIPLEKLSEEDQEFVKALRRFKPTLIEEGVDRHFRTMAELDAAAARLETL